MIRGPRISDPMTRLVDEIDNLKGWYYCRMPGACAMALDSAQRVHHLSTLVLAEMQDKTDEEK